MKQNEKDLLRKIQKLTDMRTVEPIRAYSTYGGAWCKSKDEDGKIYAITILEIKKA